MYKAVIVGSGPAGYTSAIRLAQLGAKVAIVERDLIGGICINWGCTPSKAMISSAKIANTVKSADKYGINSTNIEVDFESVAKRRDEIVASSRKSVRAALDHWGVDVIEGEAEVLSRSQVKVGERILETENVILATGSQPLIPGFLSPEEESIVGSNELITINKLPKELTIIGGGIIGMEFATIFANLGTKVRIVELLERCVSMFDPEISEELTERMKAAGVEILTGHKVMSVSGDAVKLENTANGETFMITSPMNLVAIGRKAVVNTELMDKLGVAHDWKGVVINTEMQTNVDGIYAIGDVTGRSILAHVAMQQGTILAENIMGDARQIDYSVIPAVVYSLPELASVGRVPEDKDMEGVSIHKYPFSANLRAHIEGHSDGFVKIWFDDDKRKLVAVQIVGDMAGEVIQGYAYVMGLDLDIEEVTRVISAHPTYNEILKNSLEFILGKSIEHF